MVKMTDGKKIKNIADHMFGIEKKERLEAKIREALCNAFSNEELEKLKDNRKNKEVIKWIKRKQSNLDEHYK